MSKDRRCDIFKAVDQKWYVLLGDFEYAHEYADCTCYGPFDDQDHAEAELDCHSSPGSLSIDGDGTRPVLTKFDCNIRPPTRPHRRKRQW